MTTSSIRSRIHTTLLPLIMPQRNTLDVERIARLSMEMNRDAVFWLRGTEIVYANTNACLNLGYTQAELEERSLNDIDDFLSEEEKQKIHGEFSEHGATIFETEHIRKDGSRFPVEVSATAHEIDEEILVCIIARDISERKEAEHRLRETQQQLETSLDELRLRERRLTALHSVSFDGIAISVSGVVREVNQSFADVVGLLPSECIGRTCASFLSEQSQRDYAKWAEHRSQEPMEYEILRADGSMVDMEVIKTRLEELGETIEITAARDISDQKCHARQLQLAIESGQIGTWEWNIVTGEFYFSKELARIAGISDEACRFNDEQWGEICHPDDLSRVGRIMAEKLANNTDLILEYRVKLPNGDSRWIEARGDVTSRGRDGTPEKMAGVAANIDQRKRAEHELLLRRFIVENCAEAIYVHDIDGKIVDFNEVGCTRLGYTRDEMMTMSVQDFTCQNTFREFAIPRLLSKGYFRGESEHRCKDGSVRNVRLACRLFEYEGKKLVCGTAVDITELNQSDAKQRELTQQLAHVNRLTSVGQMVSAIAHELNQPLSVVASNAAFIEMQVESEDLNRAEISEASQTIESESVRAGEIVRRMRRFCMDKRLEKSKVHVDELVRETMQLLGPELKNSGIATQMKLKSDASVLIDRIQIQQVLVNLVQNAIEASISTPLQERSIIVGTEMHTDDTVRVFVTDNGHGVVEEKRDRIFNDFETTKSNGMGMGLAISRSIVDGHGGQLTLMESDSDSTTFVLELSALRKKKSLLRVAIVDDEELVGQSFAKLLSARGYDAQWYGSSVSLLESKQYSQYDCFVVDFRLGVEETGCDLINKLRDEGVTSPMMILSGNIDEVTEAYADQMHDVKMVGKPCSAKALCESIESLIEVH